MPERTPRSAESAQNYRALLGLMLENVHIGVSNEDIVVEDQRFPAPAHLRATLVALMDEWVNGEADAPSTPPDARSDAEADR